MARTRTIAKRSSKPETPVARLRDANATKKAILAAGRSHFARHGYDGALLRDIAADAGVDAALINRYFGGKDGLFAAVLERSIRPEILFKADRANFGRQAAAALVTKSSATSDLMLEHFALVLHAATSKSAAPLLNKAVHEKFVGPIKDWIGGPDADARARLFAAMILGLIVERLVRKDAVPEKEQAAYKAHVSTMLQSLIDG
jgi:AcrR family transcriptional regulator